MSAATDACQRLHQQRDRARTIAVSLEQHVAHLERRVYTLGVSLACLVGIVGLLVWGAIS